jgi:hypothetical protein
MAIWNIDTFDSVDNANFSKFPAPYIEGVPQGVPRDGPQDNPFEGTESILGTYRTGGLVKYMHYCSRMLRWNNIDVSNIANIGTRSSCHVTKRFGDLGDMYGRGSDPNDSGLSYYTGAGIDYNKDSNMCRYRFNPITKVKYSQYTARGMRYGDQKPPPDETAISGHPFSNMTCGWSPGAEDSSFHWNPNSTQLTQISTDIAADLTTKGTTLTALQALDYTWNLCVIAWCWAGCRRADSSRGTTYQGRKNNPGGSQRDVDEVDIYYFPFIF